jgi:hypothetical protein
MARARFDNLPMDRKGSAQGRSPVSENPVVYEKREIDPDKEIITRRGGTVRQAQYAQALGLVAEPKGSQWALDAEHNLTGSWSIGFSANVGDITESGGEWTLLFIGATANADTNNSFRVYLKYDSGTYKAYLDVIDSIPTTFAVTPIAVTPGDDVDFLITSDGTTATLNVDAASQGVTISGGTFTGLNAAQVEALGTHKITTRAKGTAPVMDNLHLWGSVVTTAEYQARTPSVSSFYNIQPSDIGGFCFSPATGGATRGKTFAVPAPPQLDDSKLHFSGFGGAILVPFRQVFERYFQTQTETVAAQKFAWRLKGQRRFRSASTTLIDFGSATEGFSYLELDATGIPKFTYNGVTVTAGSAPDEDDDYDIICGCDGTDVYIILDGAAAVTATAPAFPPYLDYERIPDLYIGNDEDPALELGYHGYLTKVQFFDYALKEDTATTPSPTFDLDPSATYLRDSSKNRIAVAAITHAGTEGHPGYALGPLTDQDFIGVESDIVFGPGALGYTGIYKESIGTDLSSIRVGDRAFVHSGNSVHVLNSELSQVRPLGLPEPEADVSVQSLSSGALDGAYDYGYRWVSQDGTRGPIKRLKPVKATGAASVLIGAGDSEGQEERRELGESYGLAPSGSISPFSMTDSTDGIATTDSDGNTIETYLRFPDFTELEESIFDRGATANFSDEPTLCIEPDTPIDLDPNSDWTMQLAFRYKASGEGTYNNQGLLAIGHEDPGPTTRSFMVYLDADSTYGGESGGPPRLVVARSLGLKDSRYRYLIFNESSEEGSDDGFWDADDDYNLVAVRDGDDLRIHIHNYTDSTWKHFTGGALVGFFAGYDFPQKKIDFRATNVAFRKTGSSGNHYEGIADLPTADSGTNYTDAAGAAGTHGYRDYGTGVGSRSANRLGWMANDSHFYHTRAWSRSWSQTTIVYESEKRFVAVNGAMDDLIKSDVGFFSEDPSLNPNKFYDRVSGQYWRCYKGDTADSGVKNPTSGSMTQIKGSPTEFTGVLITDAAETAEADAQYRIYTSSLGDGSIVVTTGDASYVLPNRQWDGTASASYVKPLADANIDPQQFNWFTTTVVLTDTASDTDLDVLDLDINGNRIFDAPLGTNDTPIATSTSNIKVYLGGAFASNAGNTHIGEFRWWSKNRYDDASEYYDYLTGRVKGSEWSDLYFYATFEPADEVTAATYNHRGSLSSDLLTLVNSASIVDTRTSNSSGGATDPAPAIGIPDPPYEYITAVELFRTAAYTITDPDDDGEVQKALQLVRGLPLYKLARIPAGDSSYVDVSPDDALGAESPQAGTGQIPDAPNGIGIWQNQLLTWRGNELHFAEPSVFGWESFPSWLTYPVPVPQSGSDILAAVEVADNLLVCGRNWAALLVGSPSNPRVIDLGSGSGVQAADCLVTQGGLAFGLGTKKLWAYKEGELDASFSMPVHEMLPTNGRLAVSGQLSSLFVIDQDSDQVLRFHLPTGAWSIEERDAQDVGDYGATTAWVHTSGSYSTESSDVYADDVTTSTATNSVGTIATTSTINMASDPNAPVNSRVLVVDGTGLGVLTRVVSFT